jgi:hypothetical protein
MTSRDTSILIAVVGGVLLVVLVSAVGLGAFGTTTTVTSGGGTATPTRPLDPPRDGSSGVVFDLRHRGQGRILGIRYRRAEYDAIVAVVVPPECIAVTETGVEELSDDGACADLPIRGELSGGGVLESGHEFVFVGVPVSEDCFDALERGDPWPVDTGACVAE